MPSPINLATKPFQRTMTPVHASFPAIRRATSPIRLVRANARALDVADQFPLRAGIPVYISFGRFDRSMPCEKLDVAQAATGFVDVPCGDGDEAAPTGMRGTAFKSEFLEQCHKPVDHAVCLQVRSAIGTDDRTDGLCGLRQPLQRAPQVRVHRNPSPAALLRNDVADLDRAGYATL